MTRDEDGNMNAVARLIGQLLDADAGVDVAGNAYENERFIEWLEREVRGREPHRSRSHATRGAHEAHEIARRAQRRIRARRAGDAVVVLPLRPRVAAVVANAGQVAALAARSGCAPWVDSLSVAAGSGRELWDEPCEQWVDVPRELAGARRIALTVSGDSMTPALRSGDVILVDTSRRVSVDSVIVARRAEDGYVVKHVTRCGSRVLELSSFNEQYAPFTIERSPGSVVGVVVARLVREECA